MIKFIDTLIAFLTKQRALIIERKGRERFIQEHYKDIENAEEFWDKYH